MNTDIRIATSFLDHPKTRRMISEIGPESVISLLRLWFFVAQNKPDGDLSGFDETDLEITAQWNGESGVFAKCICSEKTRFIEKTDTGFFVHNWEDHNPYAAKAKQRKQAASEAASIRWAKERGKKALKKPKKSKVNATASEQHCGSVKSVVRNSEKGSAPVPVPVPDPSPVPSPSHLEKESEKVLEDYNSVFSEYEGLSVNPEDYIFKDQVKRLIIEKRYTLEDFKSVHVQAKNNLLHFKAHLCKWDSIYKYHNFEKLLGDSKIPTPSKNSSNANESRHIEDHEERLKIEKQENLDYQISTTKEKINIVFKIMMSSPWEYPIFTRNESQKMEFVKRVSDFIKSNETERSTVMAGVSSILANYLEELSNES